MKENVTDTLKQHGISEHVLELEQSVPITSSMDRSPIPQAKDLIVEGLISLIAKHNIYIYVLVIQTHMHIYKQKIKRLEQKTNSNT